MHASTHRGPQRHRRHRMRGRVGLIATAAVVLAGVAVSAVLIWTAPKTARVEESRPPPLVRTVRIPPRTVRIAITAYGTVIPARELVVHPEVRGRITRHHEALVPGGYIAEGDELVHIDAADYELARAEAGTALEEAEYELAVEKGRQVVASREWTLLQGDLPESEANRSLVLREPHLKRALALVTKAGNQIAKADLDMTRTTIVAPFNAIVLEESIEVGQLIDRDSAVCTLAGSDEFWVRVSLPLDKLRWVTLPSARAPGARAEVLLDSDDATGREGAVVRLLGDLETRGRMARVLVSVPDPLGLHVSAGAMPLLLGSYVRVEIDAGELHDVIPMQRAALREGDRIWVVGPDHELEIRDAKVVWRRDEQVLIAAESLREDEELVVSGLPLALPRMKVTTRPADVALDGGAVGPSDGESDG